MHEKVWRVSRERASLRFGVFRGRVLRLPPPVVMSSLPFRRVFVPPWLDPVEVRCFPAFRAVEFVPPWLDSVVVVVVPRQ
jgi:hypothetical protein